MNHFKLIIDFDSTFVKVETLDILAAICLEDNIKKIDKIKWITNMAMDGKIPFDKALYKRIKILKANKKHIDKTLTIIKNNISESIKINEEFFRENSNNCFIVSGGFKEIIWPIVKSYGFKKENVFGNNFKNHKSFKYGNILTINRDNPLSKHLGKIKIADQINHTISISDKYKTTIILGDGYTDYEVKKFGEADYFIQYIENINRKSLNKHADVIAYSFNDVINFIKKIK